MFLGFSARAGSSDLPTELAAALAGAGLSTAAPPRIESAAKDAAYTRVVLPGVAWRTARGTARIGDVALHVAAIPDGGWAFSAGLPAVLAVEDGDGHPLGRVMLNTPRLTGAWAAGLRAFSRFNLTAQNISWIPTGEGGTITADSLMIAADMSAAAGGGWSGPWGMELTNATARRAGAAAFQIDAARLAWGGDVVRLTGGAATKLDSGRASFTGEGLRVRAARDGGAPPLDMQMQKLSLTGVETGMLFTGGMKAAGFRLLSPPVPVPGIVPSNAGGRVTVSPALMEKILSGAGLADALAGAKITLHDTALEGADARTDLAGTLTVAPASVRGVTGQMTATILGLDAAAKTLQARALAPRAGAKDAEAAGIVTSLLLVGKAAAGQGGAAARSYTVDVMADGRILFNGIDISALLGGGAVATAARAP